MTTKNQLADEINKAFDGLWAVEVAQKVPTPDDLRLNTNHAKDLEVATVLYADIDGSTSMVDDRPWWFSADVYRAYLRCAAAMIRDEGGTITAYDGDRVMAVFTGDYKNTSAVRCAMKIAYLVEQIIQPAINAYKFAKGAGAFTLRHKIGVDTSQLHAARIGVRGDNDIVWIGRAANHAAKLTSISDVPSIWITRSVYDSMHANVKLLNGLDMWSKRLWTNMNNMEIYCTTYVWRFD